MSITLALINILTKPMHSPKPSELLIEKRAKNSPDQEALVAGYCHKKDRDSVSAMAKRHCGL